ncbi:hypothetical protein [Sporomusa silvacetica]|nr:hypothetical protein [Sporomusa silvacetica]
MNNNTIVSVASRLIAVRIIAGLITADPTDYAGHSIVVIRI